MKKISALYLILLMLLTMFHKCEVNKENIEIAKSINIEYIKFGTFGGFTGQVIEYEINSNNEIYKTESLDKRFNKSKLGDLDNSIVIELKVKLNEIKDIQAYKNQKNFNNFIEISTVNFKKKYIWQENDKNIAPEITELYIFLNTIIK